LILNFLKTEVTASSILTVEGRHAARAGPHSLHTERGRIMPISTARRRRINRQNAAHSTGPTSPEGRAHSSQNALKHGLRAKKHALASEDPHQAQARARAWARFYRPQSPTQQYTLDQAVEATLMLDRCAAYLRDTLNHQVRQAPRAWDQDRADHVDSLLRSLTTTPAATTRRLKRSGLGCRRLLEFWDDLAASFERRGGHWPLDFAHRALVLLGYDPAQAEEPFVALFRLHNLRARDLPAAQLEPVLREAPPSVRWQYDAQRPETLPTAAESRAWLRGVMVVELADLRHREEVLRVDYDEPERAEAVGRALLPKDTPEARLLLRYRTTYEMAFYRASKGLKELEERALEEGRGLWPDAAHDDVPGPAIDRVAETNGEAPGPVPDTAGTAEGATVIADAEPYDLAWGLEPADLGAAEEAVGGDERGSCEDGQDSRPDATTAAAAATVEEAREAALPNEASAPVATAEVPIDSGGYVTKLGTVSDAFSGLRAWLADPGVVPRPPWICEVPSLAAPSRRPPTPERS
jgi:hypothetical protein